jgi:hypothetical protein
MSAAGFLVMGDERLPYSLAAIHAAGFHNGDRITTLDELHRLADAEAACLAASDAIYRAQMSALLG